jgi:Recombination endonuclease VII
MPFKDPVKRKKYDKAYYGKTSEIYRNRAEVARYGKTIDEKVATWKAQDGKCANPHCGRKLRDPRDVARHVVIDTACWDHDHSCCGDSKACERCLRALLCVPCNRALGLMNEDRYRIQGLIEYLNKWISLIEMRPFLEKKQKQFSFK